MVPPGRSHGCARLLREASAVVIIEAPCCAHVAAQERFFGIGVACWYLGSKTPPGRLGGGR